MTFVMYAQSKEPNNYKIIGSKKTRGPKQDSNICYGYLCPREMNLSLNNTLFRNYNKKQSLKDGSSRTFKTMSQYKKEPMSDL
jgi:hypothetical protein